jgi:hypothetical protein
MKHFNNIKNLEELRKIYRDLLKKNHPDNGGNVEIMQEINAEYDRMFKILKHTAGTTATADDTETDFTAETDARIREILSKLIMYDLTIEVVGSWVWVSGNTYAYREQIKDAGLKWSKARKMWYYAPTDHKRHRGSKDSFEEIKSKYGSQKVKTSTTFKIA